MTGDAEGAFKYWKQAWDKGNRSDTLKQKIQKKKTNENLPCGRIEFYRTGDFPQVECVNLFYFKFVLTKFFA